MSTYVISDIHGCFDEFQTMLEKIRFSAEDTLYLAGDYIDRGKQSYEMLRWLEKVPENVKPIKGNHDVEFAANVSIMVQVDQAKELMTDPLSNADTCALFDRVLYLQHKRNLDSGGYFDYYGTMKELLIREKVTLHDLCVWAAMIDEFPFFYRFPMNERDCIVVHAGYIEEEDAGKAGYEDPEGFYLYAREEAVKDGGIKNGLIIAGHTPTIARGTEFYNDGEVFRYRDPVRDCVFYDIDCGCVFYELDPAATMACIRLEDEEIIYL